MAHLLNLDSNEIGKLIFYFSLSTKSKLFNLSQNEEKRLVEMRRMFYSNEGMKYALLGGDHDDTFILYRTLKGQSH